MMRSGDGSITWRRNPWKIPGPALPASTNVVVPLRRATSTASTPREVLAPVDMRVEVDQPGHDDQPTHIDDLGIAGREIMPDFSYSSIGEGNVGRLVAPGRRVDNTAACED